MTVETAVKQVFDKLPFEFSILELIKDTRILLQRPHLTDGTITRKLRKLRSDKVIDYRVIDQLKAKYQKKFKGKQLEIFKTL